MSEAADGPHGCGNAVVIQERTLCSSACVKVHIKQSLIKYHNASLVIRPILYIYHC